MPRIIPAAVIAGVVMVGDCVAEDSPEGRPRRIRELRQSEIQDLDRAVLAHLDVRGLQIAMDDALSVCGFERIGNLAPDRHASSTSRRPARQSIGQRRPLHELQHERVNAARILKPVNRGDIGMIE